MARRLSVAGTFKFGRSDADCSWDSGKVSICNTGTTLTFGGPSTFELNSASTMAAAPR